MTFSLSKANASMEQICALVEAWNKPNPLNPASISSLDYENVMSGLHDTSGYVDDFAPTDPEHGADTPESREWDMLDEQQCAEQMERILQNLKEGV